MDQFGGDTLTEELARVVRDGLVSEERLDESVHRLLLEKFRLELFEHRFVDVKNASELGADPRLAELGEQAQADAMVLLGGTDLQALPLAPGSRVYAEGMTVERTASGLMPVESPSDADVALIHLDSPWQSDPNSALGDYFRGGSLEFDEVAVAHIRELAARIPVVLVVYLERPAVLAPLLPVAAAVIGHFGASDQVIADVLTGRRRPAGRLPFDLPHSMHAVERSQEDVPFDTADPLLHHGDGAFPRPSTRAGQGSTR